MKRPAGAAPLSRCPPFPPAPHASHRSAGSSSRWAILVVALALAAPACASARAAGGERTRGLFDGDDVSGDLVSPDGQYLAPGAGGMPAEAAPVPTAEAAQAPPGLFDFDSPQAGPVARAQPAPRPAGPPSPPPPPPAGAPVAVASDAAPAVEAPQKARLVIYKGSLTVMVTAVEEATEKLAARATALGGYVENQSGNSNANNATVTLRVPAEKFHALVDELGDYGQVTQKQLSASDVSKQVFDTELRLETAEKSRQRLLDLLRTATNMNDILQIEAQVRRLTEEIERMKGELRFLRDQVAFSTLAVTFYSNAPPPTPGPTRTRSRFEWINQVGIEQVLFNF